jgi:hypothetical protein
MRIPMPLGCPMLTSIRIVRAVGPVLLGVLALSIAILYLGPPRNGDYDAAVTKSNLLALQDVLDIYEQTYGQYPWPRSHQVSPWTVIRAEDVCAELIGLPDAKLSGSGSGWDGRQLLSTPIENGVFVDRWKRPFRFRVDPKTLRPIVWSCGANGVDETNNGESPDPVNKPKGYYWYGTGDTGDDIVCTYDDWRAARNVKVHDPRAPVNGQ